MINVAVLSHERLNLLKQCVESLYATTPVDKFTLTICDDSSQDFRVRKFLNSLSYRNFSWFEVVNSGHVLSQLKNSATYYSRQRFGEGDFLHIGDSDTCFLKGWDEGLTSAAETSEIDAGFRLWGGQIHPFHQPIKQIAVDMTEHSVLDGPSWFMRWSTWDTIGGFDRTTASGPCRSEEYPWCEKLKAIGGRIGVIQPHCVIHTGLSQTDGKEAPGATERRLLIPKGVLAE